MFFKKKQSKIDPKVRFQHKQFTTKLGSARQYKRVAKLQPDNAIDKWLAQYGLGSRWVQICIGLAVLGLLYLVYVPNFLTLKNITISGVSEGQRREIESMVRGSLGEVPFYNPQRNMVFLQTSLVERAVLQVKSIQRVASVKKDFANNTVVIEAESKYNQFLIKTPEAVYDVYNDGTLHNTSGLRTEDWEMVINPAMVKVLLHGSITAEPHSAIIAPSVTEKLVAANKTLGLGGKVIPQYLYFKEPADVDEVIVDEGTEQPPKIEIPKESLPITATEYRVVVRLVGGSQKVFTLIFDAQNDIQKTVDQLTLLLNQTTPDRLSQLDYIDMRIDGRAFMCLVNTPCSKQ